MIQRQTPLDWLAEDGAEDVEDIGEDATEVDPVPFFLISQLLRALLNMARMGQIRSSDSDSDSAPTAAASSSAPPAQKKRKKKGSRNIVIDRAQEGVDSMNESIEVVRSMEEETTQPKMEVS